MTELAFQPALISGFTGQAGTLDDLSIGLFVLDQNQCLTWCSPVAASIFGIDENLPAEGIPLSHVEGVMGIGLSDAVRTVAQSNEPYVRQGIQCTNLAGRYLEIDFSCRLSDDVGNNTIYGAIRESYGAPDNSLYELQDELRILAEVASALSSTQEIGQVLRVILTGATASQGLGFNRAFLFLYDDDQNSLNGHLAVGPSSPEQAAFIWNHLEASPMSLAELLVDAPKDNGSVRDSITRLISDLELPLENSSLLGQSCLTGQWTILTGDMDLDEATIRLTRRLGTTNMALVPMVSKGHLRGLLAADNLFTSRPISDEQVRLLQVLANQAAVAMERARLYDAMVERTQQLEKANALLAESQDQIIKFEKMSVIGELTSAVAHELRNPLTVVGGFANVLLNGNLPDDQREYLNIIASEIKRAESVLDHVLDFSRASRQENQVVDLVRLVPRCLELLSSRRREGNQNIELTNMVPAAEIYGNEDQLAHAVYQMLWLIADEIIPPGKLKISLCSLDGRAEIRFEIETSTRDRAMTTRKLEQIFGAETATRRLTVMVAGETVRYHSGIMRLETVPGLTPKLIVKLPLYRREHE